MTDEKKLAKRKKNAAIEKGSHVEQKTGDSSKSKLKQKREVKDEDATTDGSKVEERDTKSSKNPTLGKRKSSEASEEKEKAKKKAKKKEKKKKKPKSTGEEALNPPLPPHDEAGTENDLEPISQDQIISGKSKQDEKESSNGITKTVNQKIEDEDDQTTTNDSKLVLSAANNSSKDVRKARREERKRLLDLVPKVDENGISFTKLQLRRMRKRVARGLDPIETEAEKQQRLREEAQCRREEEDELAGILYQKSEKSERTGQNEEEEEEGSNAENDNAQENEVNEDDEVKLFETIAIRNDHGDKAKAAKANNTDTGSLFTSNKGKRTAEADNAPPKKKRKRSKPVPTDYTCQACQNKHKPSHWIYDCPSKITMPGTNAKTTKVKGVQNPDPRKVFVSGLPFDVTKSDVTQMFAASCGKVVSCKLITFKDSGRCKGQAILAFDTEAAAQKALEQDGIAIDNNEAEKEVKSKEKSEQSVVTKRKSLKLSVSKVLSRALTKKRTPAVKTTQ